MFDSTRHCNVAVREKVPLKVAYAMTIHKAQGTTLHSVVVDCRYVTTPGQLGVAVGRATSMDGLQVIHFKDRNLMPHDRKVAEFDVAASLPFCADMSCCQRPFDDNVMPTIHATETVDEDDDNDDDGVEGSDHDDDDDDKYDDYNDADAQQSLVDEYHVDLTDLLQAAKFGDVSTSIQVSTNRAIDELLVDIDNARCYCNLQLYRLSMMYDVTRGSQTELTAFYKKVHEYLCSSQFQRELRALINCATISEGQGHAAYIIFSAIQCSFYRARYHHLRMRP